MMAIVRAAQEPESKELQVNEYQQEIVKKVNNRKLPSLLDMRTVLRDFALINYAIPVEIVRPLIPNRFEIQTFNINNKEFALLSIVPFVDTEFRFVRIAPFIKFECCQINHRLYVIDKKTKERVVWFFGHHLGSWLAKCVRLLLNPPFMNKKIF